MPGVSTTTVGDSPADGRADPAQRLEQLAAVAVDPADPLAGEELRQHPGERGTVLDDVGHPAGAAEVVLEHPVRRPRPSRITSMPATRQRAPIGTGTPNASGVKPSELSTSQRGTTPSLTICMPPTYRSSRNRLSAVTRWTKPRSRCAHSSLGMTRGTRSIGKVRSMPGARPSSSSSP